MHTAVNAQSARRHAQLSTRRGVPAARGGAQDDVSEPWWHCCAPQSREMQVVPLGQPPSKESHAATMAPRRVAVRHITKACMCASWPSRPKCSDSAIHAAPSSDSGPGAAASATCGGARGE